MPTRLTDAISIATVAHDTQVDRAGEPYILHVLRVMLAMNSDADRVVAVLHDVVEDSRDWQLGDLASFGPDVVAAVDALTRREFEDYFAYIARVAKNERAVRVKLADLHDNLDPTRLSNPSSSDIARSAKYRKARSILQDAVQPAPA